MRFIVAGISDRRSIQPATTRRVRGREPKEVQDAPEFDAGRSSSLRRTRAELRLQNRKKTRSRDARYLGCNRSGSRRSSLATASVIDRFVTERPGSPPRTAFGLMPV